MGLQCAHARGGVTLKVTFSAQHPSVWGYALASLAFQRSGSKGEPILKEATTLSSTPSQVVILRFFFLLPESTASIVHREGGTDISSFSPGKINSQEFSFFFIF